MNAKLSTYINYSTLYLLITQMHVSLTLINMIEVKHEKTSYFSITIVRKFTRYSRSSVQWRTIGVARLAPSRPHRPITMRLASRTHIFLFSVTTLLQVLYRNDQKRALLRNLKNLFYQIYLHFSVCIYSK